jgi:competence protein ComGC
MLFSIHIVLFVIRLIYLFSLFLFYPFHAIAINKCERMTGNIRCFLYKYKLEEYHRKKEKEKKVIRKYSSQYVIMHDQNNCERNREKSHNNRKKDAAF